jgi:hypothetical protein
VAVRLELTGEGLDDNAEGQRRYTFEVVCKHQLDKAQIVELNGLVESWRTVGFHGGFGGWLHSISDIEHHSDADLWKTTFSVDGLMTHLALAVLLRTLDMSDIDIVFDSVALEVQPT